MTLLPIFRTYFLLLFLSLSLNQNVWISETRNKNKTIRFWIARAIKWNVMEVATFRRGDWSQVSNESKNKSPHRENKPKTVLFLFRWSGNRRSSQRSRQGGQAGWAPPPLPPSTFCKMTLQDIVFVSNRHRLVTVWTPITRLIFPPLTLHQLRFVHQINWNWCNFFDISTGRFVPTRRRP